MKRFDVFIEETASRDGNFIAFIAILVPSESTNQARREVNNLRRKMKKQMIHFAYPAAFKLPIQSGLPEIHASHIWQGIEDFKCSFSVDERMPRHFSWLRQVLKITRQFDILHMNVTIQDVKAFLEIFDQENNNNAFIRTFYPHGISIKKAEAILSDPSINMLYTLLLKMQRYLLKIDGYANIVCDKGRKNEVYRVLESFSDLQANGLFSRMSKPIFLDGIQEPLLQVVDVVAYFFQRSFAHGIGNHYKQELSEACRKFLYDYDVGENHYREFAVNKEGAGWILVLIEAIFRGTTKSERKKAELALQLPQIAAELFNLKMKKSLSSMAQGFRQNQLNTTKYESQ